MKSLIKLILRLDSMLNIKNEEVLRWIYLISIISLVSFKKDPVLIICALVFCIWTYLSSSYPALDKLGHNWKGILYTLPMIVFYHTFKFDAIWILVPSAFFGALKEFLDSIGYGNVEKEDFFRTIQFALIWYLLFGVY